jgi:hypothetical protein
MWLCVITKHNYKLLYDGLTIRVLIKSTKITFRKGIVLRKQIFSLFISIGTAVKTNEK